MFLRRQGSNRGRRGQLFDQGRGSHLETWVGGTSVVTVWSTRPRAPRRSLTPGYLRVGLLQDCFHCCRAQPLETGPASMPVSTMSAVLERAHVIAASAESAVLAARSLLLHFRRANAQTPSASRGGVPAAATAVEHGAKAARFRERASELRQVADTEVIPYRRSIRHAMADRLDRMADDLDKVAAAAHAP